MSVGGMAVRRPFTLIPALAADAEFFGVLAALWRFLYKGENLNGFPLWESPFPLKTREVIPPNPPF
jgi:hypothetical protein